MTHAYQERVKMTRRRVRSSEHEIGFFPLLKVWRKSELRVMVDCCLLVLVCEVVENLSCFGYGLRSSAIPHLMQLVWMVEI